MASACRISRKVRRSVCRWPMAPVHDFGRFGLVEPLGALLAFALAEQVGAALPWLLSAAAGCMVCVTAQEMIPQAVEEDEPAGVVSIVLGFALMMALDVAL